MKTITLAVDGDWSDGAVLTKLIGEAPVGGSYKIEEVRIACKIIDKIEAADGELSLEDAEYTFLKQRVQKQEWVKASPHIVGFVDRVLGATN